MKRNFSCTIDGSVARAAIIFFALVPSTIIFNFFHRPVASAALRASGLTGATLFVFGWAMSCFLEWIALGYLQGLATLPLFLAAIYTAFGYDDSACEQDSPSSSETDWAVVAHYTAVVIWTLSEIPALLTRRLNLWLVAFPIVSGVTFGAIYLTAAYSDGCWEDGRKIAGAFELLAALSLRVVVAVSSAQHSEYEPIQRR